MVVDGAGQPKGLAVLEQVAWMIQAPHPDAIDQLDMPDDLTKAIDFELSVPPLEVATFRSKRIQDS